MSYASEMREMCEGRVSRREEDPCKNNSQDLVLPRQSNKLWTASQHFRLARQDQNLALLISNALTAKCAVLRGKIDASFTLECCPPLSLLTTRQSQPQKQGQESMWESKILDQHDFRAQSRVGRAETKGTTL